MRRNSQQETLFIQRQHLPHISVFTPPGPLIRAAHRIKSTAPLHHCLPLCAQRVPACRCVMRELPLLFPCCSPVREGAVSHRVSHTWTSHLWRDASLPAVRHHVITCSEDPDSDQLFIQADMLIQTNTPPVITESIHHPVVYSRSQGNCDTKSGSTCIIY